MRAHTPTSRSGDPSAQKEPIAYADILKLAHDEGLKSIVTDLILQPSEENGRTCIVKATVETERGHYEGLGDADPGNVKPFLVPHLIRVAETRAKARALRDAVNCGVVSYEELDDVDPTRAPSPGPGATAPPPSRTARTETTTTRPRGNGSYRPRGDGSPEPMTEGQRRYLFRIMAGQGYQREAAENRLKEIFEVASLSEITKTAAMKMIDELLQTSAPGNGGGNGPASRPLH
jgi:hypothetical protein